VLALLSPVLMIRDNKIVAEFSGSDMEVWKGRIMELTLQLWRNQMSNIEWKKVFDFIEKKTWTANDKTSWENEQKIETIITSMAAIETTEEGKSVAATLKLEYWTGSAYFEIFDNISPIKNKAEISQRFYCSEGQPGISVDEAYRFLQNRKLEKQMQAKRKQIDNQNDEVKDERSNSSSGTGLLKKRRLNGSARAKKHKAATS
jgi:hypothetical protein